MRPVYSPAKKRDKAGFALVLALVILVLLTILVVSFFSNVTTDSVTTKQYSNSSRTKQLSDSVVQIVMGQIKSATSGSNIAWASQPGMIRTYDNTGSPLSNYKLYSSDAMATSGAQTLAQISDFDPKWNQNGALWTDLNAPVTDASGTVNFPITDGTNVKLLSKDASNNTVASYLGYDAINNTTGASSPDGLPDVAGFSIDPASVTYDPAQTPSPTNTPVPMPVKWLYQLRDGSLAAPSTNGTNQVKVAGASSTNPIVARVAFWTDDETSKVNINTAGEGTPWDTPHFQSSAPTYDVVTSSTASQFSDYAYAVFQPAQFEFQRYPGHPAQVALSPIFAGVLGKNMAGVTPRLVWGGSEGGTKWAGGAAPTIDLSTAPRKALYASVDELMFSGTIASGSRQPNQLSAVAITKSQLEKARFFITAKSRAPELNLFGTPRIACWPIDADLSTNPNSSRTSAFDRLIAFCSTVNKQPYYFQRSKANSTTYDWSKIPRNQTLYAYLQSLTGKAVPGFGGNFSSKYASDRDQILTQIFDYIRCTNLMDSTLGAFNAPTMKVWERTTRQFSLYMSNPFGSLFSGQVAPIKIGITMGQGRYSTVKDLSVIFICTGDGTLPATSSLSNAAAVNAYIAQSTTVTSGSSPSTADILKLESNCPTTATDGIPALAPATAGAYLQSNPADWTKVAQYWRQCMKVMDGNGATRVANLTLAGTALAPTEKRFQMAVMPNPFNTAPGLSPYGADLLVQITGLEQFQITGATNIDGGALFPSAGPTSAGYVEKWFGNNGDFTYGAASRSTYFHTSYGRSPLYFRTTTGGNLATSLSSNSIPNANLYIYPFISRAFTLPGTVAAMTFSGASTPLQVKVYVGQDANDSAIDTALHVNCKDTNPGVPTQYSTVINAPDNLIQTLNIPFPAGNFPIPTLVVSTSGAFGNPVTTQAVGPENFWGFDTRFGNAGKSGATVISGTDVAHTVSIRHGDARIVAASANVPDTIFDKDPNWNLPAKRITHSFAGGSTQFAVLVPGSTATSARDWDVMPAAAGYNQNGDFDGPNRAGNSEIIGSFINKPDEGDPNNVGGNGGAEIPYYGRNSRVGMNVNLYTPNRLMPSPGMFGSLPTGVARSLVSSKGDSNVWQTLLFRPQSGHPNASSTIPDHLIMDLFWMPVVEPYAISEPFSTDGKINLNYQIAPFTYLTRSTAVVSALQSEKIGARPRNDNDASATQQFRLSINTSETGGTLQQFKQKFAAGNLFRSASEICDIDLVPIKDPNGVSQTWSSNWASTFWTANANTGDNIRERPYTNLYARLTTKSNTYTVHFRVQSLQKLSGTAPDQWVEGRDKVVGEYRGSSLIERYIDPSDPSLPDFADPANFGKTLDAYYKFRVVSTKKFDP